MTTPQIPVAVLAADVPVRARVSSYPEPFASRMEGREKRVLGDLFGLTNFGVNLTRLSPNSSSSLRHSHAKQDEFVYIFQGRPTLCTEEGRTQLAPGMCAGFRAGTGNGHNLVNETGEFVLYLEIGDRTPGDETAYPDDDLKRYCHHAHVSLTCCFHSTSNTRDLASRMRRKALIARCFIRNSIRRCSGNSRHGKPGMAAG